MRQASGEKAANGILCQNMFLKRHAPVEHMTFQSAGEPFEDDLDLEPRRKIIVINMHLNPDTTTWYKLAHQYQLFCDMGKKGSPVGSQALYARFGF